MKRQIFKAWGLAAFVTVIAACSVSTVENSPSVPVSTASAVPVATIRVDPTSSVEITEMPERDEARVDSTAEQTELAETSQFVPDMSATATPPTTLSTPSSPTRASPTPSVPTVSTPQTNPQVSSMFGPITCRDGEESIELSELIYEPELFDIIVPMGRMWDSHVTPTDHMYFFSKEEHEVGFVKTPAAGRLISVGSFPRPQSPFWDPSVTAPDLRVIIAHSCTLFSIFIHVGELVPEIAELVGEIPQGGNWHWNSDSPIELQAGDPIAIFAGSSFDYSLHDQTQVLPGFQVPEHYDGESWKVYTVDPFDYMTDEIVAALLPKNVRQVEPYGGKIDYDVKGTLAGNWFLDGTVDYSGGGLDQNRYWNGHLSIAYDHIDPTEIRISIGRDIGLTQEDCRACGNVYAVMNNSPNPTNITAVDGVIRYELTGRIHLDDTRERTTSDGNSLGTFLAQVIDDATIRVEFVRGVDAESVQGFSDNSVLYRR